MKVYLRDYLSQTEDSSKITSAYHFFDPDNRHGGYLVGLISASSKTQFKASNVTRFVWNGIVDEFSGSTDGSIDRLKDTISAGEDKLLELLKNDQSEDVGVDLNFSIAHFVNGMVYFGFFGSTNVQIFHEDELVEVSSLLKESNVYVGSTQIMNQDVVLLSSEDFWSSIDFDITEKGPFKEILQAIEIAQIDLGSGVLMASPGVDFQTLLLEDSMREIGLIPGAAMVGSADKSEDEVETEDEVLASDQSDLDQIDESTPDSEKDSDNTQIDKVENLEQHAEISTDPIEDKVDKELSGTVSDEGVDTSDQSYVSRLMIRSGVILSAAKLLGSKVFRKVKPVTSGVSSKSGDSITNAKSWTNRYMMNKYGRKTWFKKTRAKLSQNKITTPSFGKLKVDGYRENSLRKKRFLILGGVALVVISAFFGIRAAGQFKDASDLHTQFQAFYDEAANYVEKAEKSVSTESESAEVALMSIEKLFDEQEYEINQLNQEDQELYEELNARVLGVSDTLGKVVKVSEDDANFALFLDTKLQFTEKSGPTDIATFADESTLEYLVVTDLGNKAVYVISTSDSSVNKIADPDSLVQSPLFVDIGVDGIYVYDDVNGVLKAPFGEIKSVIGEIQALSGVSASDFSFDQPEEFAVLTETDNFYLVDSETLGIYKSARTSSGSYGLPYKYFGHELLSGVTDFFADFSIYSTAVSPSPFNRFIFNSESGDLVNSQLQIGGMRDSLGEVTSGYTGGTLDKKLYLFDEGQSRILAFEKPSVPENRHPGQMILKAQYLYRGDKNDVFGEVQDLVTDSQESTIYILDGTRIWSIKMK